MVELGYLAGITHKLLYSPDKVLYLYILNFVMVGIDICLYYRNRKLDRDSGLLERLEAP